MAESDSGCCLVRRAKSRLIIAEMRRLGLSDEEIRETFEEAIENLSRREKSGWRSPAIENQAN